MKLDNTFSEIRPLKRKFEQGSTIEMVLPNSKSDIM